MLSSDVATGRLINGAEIFILGCRLQVRLWLLVHLVCLVRKNRPQRRSLKGCPSTCAKMLL